MAIRQQNSCRITIHQIWIKLVKWLNGNSETTVAELPFGHSINFSWVQTQTQTESEAYRMHRRRDCWNVYTKALIITSTVRIRTPWQQVPISQICVCSRRVFVITGLLTSFSLRGCWLNSKLFACLLVVTEFVARGPSLVFGTYIFQAIAYHCRYRLGKKQEAFRVPLGIIIYNQRVNLLNISHTFLKDKNTKHAVKLVKYPSQMDILTQFSNRQKHFWRKLNWMPFAIPGFWWTSSFCL